MSKGTFSATQLAALECNPYVETVTSRRIVYTDEFKRRFVEEYRMGKGPRQIFKDAGFDVEALGYKRIERASDRFRTQNNEGRLGTKIDPVEVHKQRRRERVKMSDQLAQQAELIWQLQAENLELKRRLGIAEN